ncbi:Hyaluronidase [Sphingomonas sp. EC-HK361]|uniref:beta-N-acetylglucosaminidase domain-containing protein n=1 Tax=Sphingomonas sp. EC-HK361 TaxID=2038397 RepID=UPI001254FB6C|nr:beta-N-acetylglucosaminidase domain-containing protein [Sphingomonas sp. EC-HK361]VVT08082.1 Hyaluronidase [Sphingomonas sp. EC-HK361]
MTPELGIIEGRFGRAWTWEDRAAVLGILAPAGYRFWHYGPKADAHLRRRWREPHPRAEAEAIARFADLCRPRGVRFGIALTPMDASHPFDADTRATLARRVAELAALGIDDLAILFDDLRGDLPGLASAQADIVHACEEHARGAQLYFCPTYYSDDTVLDRVFGARPADYLPDLGRRLDPSVRIYWTGEEVCAREIRPGHLQDVEERIGRPVCLWDNYPVNDGARMSQHLHLRAFTGRDAGNGAHLTGHAINPSIQPLLSCIPALTLPMSYARGAEYRYGAAFREAAESVAGPALGARLEADLLALQDAGLGRLPDAKKAALTEIYAAFDHPVAREVLGFLAGADTMTDEEVQTQ